MNSNEKFIRENTSVYIKKIHQSLKESRNVWTHARSLDFFSGSIRHHYFALFKTLIFLTLPLNPYLMAEAVSSATAAQTLCSKWHAVVSSPLARRKINLHLVRPASGKNFRILLLQCGINNDVDKEFYIK